MVLDASAVLALLEVEPGWERVAEAMDDGVISAVNLSEVIGKLTDRHLSTADIRAVLGGLDLEVAPFDEEAAYGAAAIRRLDGAQRLSLGDRACLGLAHTRQRPALTGDRQWASLDTGVEIVLIR